MSDISYDANGNIQRLARNKGSQDGNNAMDDLSYIYKADKPNQLLQVEDAHGEVANAEDIGTQGANNYVYNEIGQLIRNNAENIAYFYNASGLVTQVDKDGQPAVKFFYNDRNHRVKKERFINGSLTNSTFYVRDVAGQVLAIYSDGGGSMAVAERPVYGNGRIGMAYGNAGSETDYVYQLTDHLGNVRVTFTKNGSNAGLEGYTDYYPFGMPMPQRSLIGPDGYRYAFQGQEKDPETGKEAFELRLWDARIGRWLTTDPAGQYASPYLGMGNNPITRVDPDGGFDVYQKQEDGSFKWVEASDDIVFLDVDGSEITRFSGFSIDLNGIHLGEDYADAMRDIYLSGEVSYNDYDEVATYNLGLDITDIRNGFADAGPSPKVDKIFSNLKLAKRADKFVDAIRSSKGLLKKAQLPVKGKIRFVPRAADIKNGAILQKHGGYVDKFGNVWKKPKGTIIGERHWDVQLSEIGKQRMGWLSNSGKHINVSIDGRVVH